MGEKIYMPEQLGSIEFKAVLPTFLEDELIIALNKLFPNQWYDIKTGMTKTTVVFPELPYVFKIPHNGVYISKVKHFDDVPTELEFRAFKKDYCKEESNFYINYEVPRSIAKIFLPISQISLQKDPDIVFYIQGKALMLEDKWTKDLQCWLPQEIKDLNMYDIPSVWLEKVINIFSIKECKDLLNFLIKYPEIAEDLSCENLGFINGFPVITDYAGLYEYE